MSQTHHEIDEILKILSEMSFYEEMSSVNYEKILQSFNENSSFFLNKLISDETCFPIFKYKNSRIPNHIFF